MALWRCENCDREMVCDPVCDDEDADGEQFGIGPECPECEETMEYEGEDSAGAGE